jgi:hypothetical protein
LEVSDEAFRVSGEASRRQMLAEFRSGLGDWIWKFWMKHSAYQERLQGARCWQNFVMVWGIGFGSFG